MPTRRAIRPVPFWEEGRSRGTAGSESLAPAPSPPNSPCCRQSGPGHGAAHPWPACLLPCGNPGTVLRRGERPPPPESDGSCSLWRRPQPPLSRHHIALSLSNTARLRDWQGRAPAHASPPPHWAPSRDCAAGPASLSFVRRGYARALCDPTALGPAPAEPRCRHGEAGRPAVHLPAGRWERDTKRSVPTGGRRCLVPGQARPAHSQARPQALHGLQCGAGRESLARCRGQGGPACVRPGLARIPSSRGPAPAGRGWHHPGSDRGGSAPALIGLRRGVNCQPMWRGRWRWRLLK